ncbi:MAG: uracil-DNA glycosylase [Solirubrobacteraceae bacterium]|jgi:DNA polymerase|nr:uracil-DNA glycosylase [Solirubrobacteraceae bacterium]
MTSLTALSEEAAGCRACPLWEDATQTVFGQGPRGARAVIVGETPGDQEDKAGEPFVGPAGRELDQALERAGLDRAELYVTNAVKHFKFEERGKRRIHQKPTRAEVKACMQWLEQELAAIRPLGLLAMGATAAQALLGSQVRVTKDRGQPLESARADLVMVTIHPSAILRARSDGERLQMREEFTADLQAFAAALS